MAGKIKNNKHLINAPAGSGKTTYGIKCDEVSVKDVSPNKEEVAELIDRLNKYGLSPCHLQDVIEDFIQE